MDSPVILDYKNIKSSYMDCILLFRIGEFYELFFEDANEISDFLGLVLSYKTKNRVPMCGFPKNCLDIYIYRMLNCGYKVAVCEEKKGLDKKISRDVVRVFTKGTLIEDDLLKSKEGNFILLYMYDENIYATCDVSTGDVYLGSAKSDLENLITSWDPSECIVDKKIFDTKVYIQCAKFRDRMNFVDFQNKSFGHLATDLYSNEQILIFTNNEIEVLGHLINYINHVHKDSVKHLKFPIRTDVANNMRLEAFTIRNLEIFQKLNGQTSGSIYSILKNTATSTGARLLRYRLQKPSSCINIINDRLLSVEHFIKHNINIRQILSKFFDIERCVCRISLGKSSLRDLFSVIRSLSTVEIIYNELKEKKISQEIDDAVQKIGSFYDLLHMLKEAFTINEALVVSDGGFIKKGYCKELDEMIIKKEMYYKNLDELKDKYIKECKINTLEINRISNLHFLVEVPKSKSGSITYSFKNIQNLASSIRYNTDELEKLSNNIISVEEQISTKEKAIFDEFCEIILHNKKLISDIADSIAIIDVAASCADLAKKNKYVKPNVVKDNILDIVDGRNIIVENGSQNFIPNSCHLDNDNSCILMTGANMSGKTTFLKQNGIIALMAHVGMYVPAKFATIGISDAIFVRVGATDDISKGMSTFMVEMDELGKIVNNSTKSSIVIIDEIGRGTSSREGMSIAFAALEYFVGHRIRTLFATHYLELADFIKNVQYMMMEVVIENDIIKFKHRIINGCATQSHAMYVGRMAGLPESMLVRAKEMYEKLS